MTPLKESANTIRPVKTQPVKTIAFGVELGVDSSVMPFSGVM
jgi:hypothetical protein